MEQEQYDLRCNDFGCSYIPSICPYKKSSEKGCMILKLAIPVKPITNKMILIMRKTVVNR